MNGHGVKSIFHKVLLRICCHFEIYSLIMNSNIKTDWQASLGSYLYGLKKNRLSSTREYHSGSQKGGLYLKDTIVWMDYAALLDFDEFLGNCCSRNQLLASQTENKRIKVSPAIERWPKSMKL